MLSSLDRINAILKDIGVLQTDIEAIAAGSLTAGRADKSFLYLEDQLEKMMLKLDAVESSGEEEVRTTRRNAVKLVEKLFAALETKLATTSTSSTTATSKSQQQQSSTTAPPAPSQSNNWLVIAILTA